MGKKVQISDIFQPGDLLAGAVVIAGVLIAIFLDGLAIKLIGVSVAILGGLALVMLIAQRLSDVVESNKFNLPQQPNIRMTVVKDSSATRQTVENFEDSFDGTLNIDEELGNTMGTDEGFRIVSKSSRMQTPKSEETVRKVTNDTSEKLPISLKPEDDEKPVAKVMLQESKPPAPKSSDPKPTVAETTISKVEAENVEIKTETVSREEKTDSEEPTPIVQQAVIAEKPYVVEPEEIPVIIKEEIIEKEPVKEPSMFDENPAEEIDTTQSDNQHLAAEVRHEPKINIVVPKIEDESTTSEIEHNLIANETIDIPDDEELIAEDSKEDLDEKCKKKQVELPISLLSDDDMSLSPEPRKEFEFFVSRALLIIRSVIKTRTAAFMLVNTDRTQLILESYVTNMPDAIIDSVRIPIGNDVASQIVRSAKPEILTEIARSAELDLIPYYSEEVGTSSFIGLPVFYEKQVVGIICCDTGDKNAYDAATVSFLGQFSKLISGLIKSYTEKFDLLQSEKTVSAIKLFNSMFEKTGLDSGKIGQALTDTLFEMYEVGSVGACLFDEARNGWYVLSYTGSSEFPVYLKEEPVDLERTLIAQSIINSSIINEQHIKTGKTRVNSKEFDNEGGYFMSFPIKSDFNTYGALYIEGNHSTGFNNFDFSMIEILCKIAGSSIEKLNLINMLQNGSVVDPDTGLMNSIAFFRRLSEEVARTRDLRSSASLCLISIDKYSSFELDPSDANFEKINYHIINLINKNLHEYDILGRVDTNVLAVVLIGNNIEKAKLWAERIRNSAAISVVEIDHRRFTVTLSIGAAELSPSDDVNSLIENTGKALNIAISKTNNVHIYQ